MLNARDARWREGVFGAGTTFEGDPEFEQLGININVIEPGQPLCMYHREEEQERPLKAWDFVHCPAGTNHVFVGAGSGPCTLLAVGSRAGGKIVYPVSELAQRHNAGVPKETPDPNEAYAPFPRGREAPYREGWLR